MAEILPVIIGIAAMVSVPTASFLLGLKFKRPHLYLLANEIPALFRFSLVIFVLMPFIAALLFHFNPANHKVWSAMFVLSISPVMPLIIDKKDGMTKYNTMMQAFFITALLYSLVLIPLSLIVIQEVLNLDFRFGTSQIISKLLTFFILPMGIGFLLQRVLSDSHIIIRAVEMINKLATIVLLAGIFVVAVFSLSKMDPFSALLVMVFLLLALAIGFITGRFQKNLGTILASALLLRIPAPAIIFAQINNMLKDHLPFILLYVLAGAVLYMALLKKRKRSMAG